MKALAEKWCGGGVPRAASNAGFLVGMAVCGIHSVEVPNSICTSQRISFRFECNRAATIVCGVKDDARQKYASYYGIF